jgi:hypothetical protein
MRQVIAGIGDDEMDWAWKSASKAGLNVAEWAAQLIVDAYDEEHAPPPQTLWQPIETAPKDGTCILISNGKDGIFSGMYVGYWYQEGGWKFSIKNRIPDATHWMPLPAPPTGEKP